MKICNIRTKKEKSSIENQLMEFVISQFENAHTERYCINSYNMGIFEYINKSDLVIIHTQNGLQKLDEILSELKPSSNNKIIKKPFVFVIHTSPTIDSNKQLPDNYPADNVEVIEHYHLNNLNQNFKNGEITYTPKLGELLRKVNRMKINHFKSEYKFEGFTCGIDPNRDYCGDAIEY